MSATSLPTTDENDIPAPDRDRTAEHVYSNGAYWRDFNPDREPLASNEPRPPVNWRRDAEKGCSCQRCSPTPEPLGWSPPPFNDGSHVKLDEENPDFEEKFPETRRSIQDRSDSENVDAEHISPGAPRTWFKRDDVEHPSGERKALLKRLYWLDNDHSNPAQAQAVKDIARNRTRRADKELFARVFAERVLSPTLADDVIDVLNQIDTRKGILRNRSIEQIEVGICAIVLEDHLPDDSDPGYTTEKIEEIRRSNERRIERLRLELKEAEGKDENNALTKDSLGKIKDDIRNQQDRA